MADYLSHVLAFLEDRQAPAASIAIAKKLVSLGGVCLAFVQSVDNKNYFYCRVPK